VDPPRSGREQTEIKSAAQVHTVPAPGGGEAATTEGATSSPNGSPKAAAQTELFIHAIARPPTLSLIAGMECDKPAPPDT
jgi:hypothetical protein